MWPCGSASFSPHGLDAKLGHKTFFGQWNVEEVLVCQLQAKTIKDMEYSYLSCHGPAFHPEKNMPGYPKKKRDMWSRLEPNVQLKAELCLG